MSEPHKTGNHIKEEKQKKYKKIHTIILLQIFKPTKNK